MAWFNQNKYHLFSHQNTLLFQELGKLAILMH